MTDLDLYAKLERIDHTMDKRRELSQWVLDNHSYVSPLLELSFRIDDPLSVKACWVLEFAARSDLRFLDEHLDYFVDHLPELRDESALRPMAKICEALIVEKHGLPEGAKYTRLTSEQLEKMATVCFDWLIGHHKVATKAFAMSSLYLLGKTFDWIHPELQMVLEKDFPNESAAFKARARHILKRLSREIKT